MSTLPAAQMTELDRLQRRALGVGAAALLVCVVGALFSPAQFFRAYLAAYQFYLGIALGCFAILMLYHLTGGAWGFLLRRFLEAGMRTLPLLAVLFTPIACGVRSLYLWARPEVVAGNPELQYNHIYLNVPFFWFRAALWLIGWNVVAYILGSWSRQQDRTGEPHLPRKFRLLSAPGLIVYGVGITFAAVDWIMSLQPTFHSTIFGPLVATGQLVSGQAFVILLLAWLAGRPPLRELISLEALNDIGNLLLTFLIIWAYMAFFQFMLVWIANLPDEVIWYLPRARGGWAWVAWALFVGHFVVPFFALLLRDVKRNPATLARVAGLILFMQLVFNYFQVMPAFSGPEWEQLLPDFPADRLSVHWLDFLTPVGLGGIWLAYLLWQLKRYPVLPRHDPSRADADHLRRLDQEQAVRQEAIGHG